LRFQKEAVVIGAETASAIQRYRERVDAVIAQRTRLRGPQPPGDLFAGVPPGHPILNVEPHAPLNRNQEVIASYIQPDDVVIDVGGGAGRVSLPLALRCREVINVDESAAMGRAFIGNASRAGLKNARFIEADWRSADPPVGTVALVNHVTYYQGDIAGFIERIEKAGTRRAIITVNSPPPPSSQRVLFELVHGEAEEIEPGHVELLNALWEIGLLPDVVVLPEPSIPPPGPFASRDVAIAGAMARFTPQWAFWPRTPELDDRVRGVLEDRFDELFERVPSGFSPTWFIEGREILITWRPGFDRQPA
jgi:SAM-dependent methyltransferase